MIYGSFMSRLLAFIFDYLIIAIPLSILWYIFSIPIPTPNHTFGNLVLFSSPLAWLVGIFYYGIMESGTNQATYGKKAMGLKVTGKNGEHLSFRRAAARTLNKFFSPILFLGYLMFFFNKRRQTFHDWLTNSIVVKKESNSILTDETVANN